jgi:hypothetical protein
MHLSLWEKLKSRKLWVASAGIITSAVADKPVLSAILGGVYIILEGIIDAVRVSRDPAGR